MLRATKDQHVSTAPGGAKLHSSMAPATGERIFDKQASTSRCSLFEGFERYLVERGVEHLSFLDVYHDGGLDANARVAFQKGYYV